MIPGRHLRGDLLKFWLKYCGKLQSHSGPQLARSCTSCDSSAVPQIIGCTVIEPALVIVAGPRAVHQLALGGAYGIRHQHFTFPGPLPVTIV